MKFKIDENLPVTACQILQNSGHDAVSVFDQHLEGKPDNKIADVCKEEHRILITLDSGFANILAYPPNQHTGIIVIRTRDQSKPVVLALVQQVASALAIESPQNQLWIVEPDRIRVRESNR